MEEAPSPLPPVLEQVARWFGNNPGCLRPGRPLPPPEYCDWECLPGAGVRRRDFWHNDNRCAGLGRTLGTGGDDLRRSRINCASSDLPLSLSMRKVAAPDI